MPSVYGSWRPSSGAARRMRLWIDYSVSVSGSAATVSGGVYVQAGNWFWDATNQFSMSGSLGVAASGSRSVNVPSGGSQLIQSFSQTVALGSSPQTRTVNAALSGIGYIGDGYTASVEAAITIPAGQAPAADAPNTPWDVRVRRINDFAHELLWTVTAPAGKPIDDVIIQRWSRRSKVGWQAIAVIPGAEGTRSWVDNTTDENDWYIWRLITRNAAGAAPPAESAETPTTPAAPTDLILTRNTAGDVLLRWSRNAPLVSRHDVQVRSSADGATWGPWQDARKGLPDSVTQVVLSGLDGALLWQARVQAIVNPDQTWGVTSSAPSAPVQPLTPPAAPTLLEPNRVVSSLEALTWVWRHNPRDTTTQTAAEIRYRPLGAQSWPHELKVQGAEQQTTSPAPLNAGEWEWQARTKGAADTWGPWSPLTTVRVENPPTVTITKPANGSVIHGNRLTLDIDYFDGSGATMASHIRYLYGPDGVLEEAAENGARTQIGFNTVLANKTSYTARIAVVSGTGLRSTYTETTITTDFLPPTQPLLTGAWERREGLARLTVTNQAKREDVTDDTAYNRIERSLGGGSPWLVLANNLGLDPLFVDRRVPLNQAALYRVVAVSPLGVEAASETLALATRSGWVWFIGEDGAAFTLRHNIELGGAWGHAVKTEQYLGRRLPEAHIGPARPVKIQASATLVEGEDLDQDITLLLGRVVHYRDPEGRAVWVLLDDGGVSLSQRVVGIRKISITAEAVEHDDTP